jgi:hypothetical protein
LYSLVPATATDGQEAVGGSLSLGESVLKSIEASKNGEKLTIVLRKNKPKKNKPDA